MIINRKEFKTGVTCILEKDGEKFHARVESDKLGCYIHAETRHMENAIRHHKNHIIKEASYEAHCLKAGCI